MSTSLSRVARAAAGVALLLVLALVVRGFWSDFRAAERAASARTPRVSADASSTPSTSEGEGQGTVEETTAPVAPAATSDDMLTVLIDGLNFRTAPKDDARALRGLDKGEKLDLLSERGGWYEVRDTHGATGWVSSNPNYVKTGRR